MFNRKIKRWHIWTLVLSILLLTGVVGVFVFYSVSLGGVSGEAEDWGSFGSLLSGVFTLIAAIAASAAFFVTRVQLDKLVDHQKEQESSLVFDRYLKHRDLFIARCRELEVMCGDRIRFYSPSELYRKIFPFNSPSYCSYEISEEADNELEAWIEAHKKIGDALRLKPSPLGRVIEPVFDFARLMGFLSIEYQSNRLSRVVLSDGDHDLGYGVYDLSSLYGDLKSVLDELSFFSGSEKRCLDPSGLNWAHVICGLRKEFDSFRGDAGLKLRDETAALRILHIVFERMDNRHRLEGYKDSKLGAILSNLLRAFKCSERLRLYLMSDDAELDSIVMVELRVEQAEEYRCHLLEYQAQRVL